ncbi:SxtJ family membrane protein [Prochlorococcus sp. MIT 1011]|uniref:SxtJ family membrane protein n=1 Tax=Prochlorococcus sp. MIT 1011 TaxID=3082520 RepID=UPI0039B5339D
MNNHISKKKLKEFSYLIGIGLPVIVGWILPLMTGHLFRSWTLWISIPILLTGVFCPYKLSRVYAWWMKLGHILGWINSRIILGLVFLLVLQPIAFFMRLFQYDPLRKGKTNLSSYKEDKKNSKVDLTRIF